VVNAPREDRWEPSRHGKRGFFGALRHESEYLERNTGHYADSWCAASVRATEVFWKPRVSDRRSRWQHASKTARDARWEDVLPIFKEGVGVRAGARDRRSRGHPTALGLVASPCRPVRWRAQSALGTQSTWRPRPREGRVALEARGSRRSGGARVASLLRREVALLWRREGRVALEARGRVALEARGSRRSGGARVASLWRREGRVALEARGSRGARVASLWRREPRRSGGASLVARALIEPGTELVPFRRGRRWRC
jgi:hypothetical protein